nr:hypothetical protein [Tanacetum cinerariifolium]
MQKDFVLQSSFPKLQLGNHGKSLFLKLTIPCVPILVSVGCQKPGHLAARLGCAETKVATWDDLAFKLITRGNRNPYPLLSSRLIPGFDSIFHIPPRWDTTRNSPKCGNPVDGHYCQRCALLRKKFKEDLFTYCIENGILQDSSEPFNNNTNIVNALQEPFVVKQGHGKKSSQSPQQINHHCCYGCGDPLEDIFCHQCTYELYGKGAHYGYNCSPKVPIIPNPEPFNNQTVDELPQTVPSFNPTCYFEDGNSFTYDSTSNLVHDSPKFFDPPLQPPIYSHEFYGNDAFYGYNCLLQVPFTYDPKPCYNQDFNFP